jgi:thiamine pyrophosphokinase
MDHVLGNLSAAKGFRNKIRIIFLNPHQKYFLAPKRLRITGARGRIVSIMPFPLAEGVTLRGFKYPLKEATLRLGGRIGIRNVAVRDAAKVSFEKGCLIVFLSQ